MSHPGPQFGHIVSTIHDLYPDFVYVHVAEPRVNGHADRGTIPAYQLQERDALYGLLAPSRSPAPA
ncbi:hypothetical protein FIBSPDRAFT_847098, partial [Athelia psychrophila]